MISIIIFALLISFSADQTNNRIETYAEISEFKSVKSSGRRSVFTYIVDDQKFNQWGYYNNTLIKGDKFVVKVDLRNPGKANILLDRPIFLDNEETTQTYGVITRLLLRFNREVYFEYTVNGAIYTRIQRVPKDWKKKYSHLTVGQKYKVEYWNENPRRAIIELDTIVN